jgi:LmeA-like phospholipid-binding
MSAFSADLTRPDLPARRRRRRWPIVVLVIVLVLAGLAVLGDRIAAAYAERRIASEVQKEGFGTRPDVTIYGFPFLTQVAGRHFPHARMTARNLREGPLTISRIDGDARDVRVGSGFRSGTIGTVDGTATVSFGDLAKAGGQPDLALSAAGPNTVKAEVDLDVATATATATITKVGNAIRVHGVAVEGFPLSDLGDDLDFTVPVTGLPMGLRFRSLTVTSKGVAMRVTGSHLKFSG